MAYQGTVYSPVTSKALSVTNAGTDTTTVSMNATVRLLTDADCFINFSTTATSDGTNMKLIANLPEYIKASSGNIAAKTASGTATLYISEMI